MKIVEEWKSVVGFPDYEVSSTGRVRRVTGACGTQIGRVLKPKLTQYGYHEVVLRHKNKAYAKRVSRLVCEAFNGPPPTDKPFALHANDVKIDNTPTNLYWGDRAENGADAKRNARYPSSVAHRLARVTPQVIRSIREMAATGLYRFEDIGQRHGISKSQAHKIARGKQHGELQ